MLQSVKKENLMNLNIYLPLSFFLILLSFPNYQTFPFLVFSGLFLDFIVYDFFFLNTIVLLILFIFSYSFKKRNTLYFKMFLCFINTVLYYLFWMLYQEMNLIFPLFFNIIWNLIFVIFVYHKEPIHINNKL